MTKYTRKLMPFISCDIPAIEKWLSDMARQGLVYDGSGTITVRFAHSQPVERRYRLEYADVTGRQIKDEKREMYEESGWTVMDDIMSGFVVLYSDDPEAPEPYDAWETIQPLEKIRKRQLTIGILFIALLFSTVKIGPLITSLSHSDRGILLCLLEDGTWCYIVLVLLAVLLLGEGIFRIIRARRLKKYIEALKAEESTPKLTRKNAIGTLLIVLTAPLIVIWAIQLVFFRPGVTTYYMADPAETYPFPVLAQINEEEGKQLAQLQDHGAPASSRDSSDLLAPTMTAYSTEFYPDFSYRVQYYEMRNEKLAQRLYKEMLYSFTDSALANRHTAYQTERAANEFLALMEQSYVADDKLALSGVDEGVYIVDRNDYSTPKVQMNGKCYQYLILRQGKEVVHVQYLGQSNLKNFAALYEEYLGR